MIATTCHIDDFGPLTLVEPASVEEIGERIREAGSAGTALYPVGGQTGTSQGNPPSKPGLAVDMRKLAEVVDFPARDMTITVQAGITIERLKGILAHEKLHLPIDVGQADRATLGGVLAVNASGPRRYGYGTLRDYIIGISACNDMGEEFKAGGRVVKNVAGYDLCKLLVGSLGTLGIITQATLKLRPSTEEQALICISAEEAALEGLLKQLHGTRTLPVCIDLMNRAAAEAVFPQAQLPVPEAAWVLLVGYEGNGDAVHWQVQQLVKELAVHDHLAIRVGFTSQRLWTALCEWNAGPATASTVFKANLLPGAVAAFCAEVSRATGTFALRAHAGNGIVYGSWSDGLTKEQAAGALSRWRELAAKAGGSVVVPRCPPAWKATLSVWGPEREDAWLMREIKNKFDPRRIFNPGRFVAGI